MRSADRLAASDRRKKCGSTREDMKEKRLGSWCRPDDGSPEAETPAVCLGNLGPKGKRGLDWCLGVQCALLSPTARARPQNPCSNSSSRGCREPGLKKSRGGTQGLTANRAPVGWEMVGCLIKDRGGQASWENHSHSSHLDWHPKNDAKAQSNHGEIHTSSQSLAGPNSSATGNNQRWFWFPSGGGCQDGALSQKEPGIQLHLL